MMKENLHTSIEIIDKSTIKVSFDLVKLIRKLLSSISEEHLEGLDSIILVDRLLGPSRRYDPFIYRKQRKTTPANIELSINGFYQNNPKAFFLMAFLRKLFPAMRLYHAVGIHYEHIKGDVPKNERREFIKKFVKTYLRKTFPISTRIVKMFVPVIRRLAQDDRK